jgi:hypothetical protein
MTTVIHAIIGKCSKIQILGNDGNIKMPFPKKPRTDSVRGMLTTIQFKTFSLPASCLKMQRIKEDHKLRVFGK